jgi:two-component system nitrate/nitrite response regulator NarL
MVARRTLRPLKILLASSDPARRRRWSQALKGLLVYEATDIASLEHSMASLKPAVLILDRSLPNLHGIEAVSVVQRASPSTKIILFSKVISENEGRAMLEAGVRGYCSLDIDATLLKKAIIMVHQGEVWVSRKFISQLLEALVSLTEAQRAKSLPKDDSALEQLTPREREIAELLGVGASNKEIAHQLRVAEKTVKAHLTSIFRKLEIPDRLHLALFVNGLRPAH